MADHGSKRNDVICYGALGFGGFKLETRGTRVARLIESTDRVFDALKVNEIPEQTRDIE